MTETSKSQPQADQLAKSDELLDLYWNALVEDRNADARRLRDTASTAPEHTATEYFPLLDDLNRARRIWQSTDTRPTSLANTDSGESRFDAQLASGDAIEDLEIIRPIARGGMGAVYLARQRDLDRLVAVKVMRFGELATPDQIARFRAESKAAAQLQHRGIVAVHQSGRWRDYSYFTMDYVPGPTLAQILDAGPLDPKRATEYMVDISRATQAAHNAGILHRDLKPSNVLINLDDQPRITDFGLAKFIQESSQQQLSGTENPSRLTLTGLPVGTPSYMSPEQATATGQALTPATDIYSLGAIFYELLTGRPPFCGASPLETLKHVVHQEPVSPRSLNPSVPRDLETIALKCLSKEPALRYPSAGELAEDLIRYQTGRPILARPASRIEKLHRWGRRNPLPATLAMSVIALIGVLVVGVCAHLWQTNIAYQRQVASGQHAAEQRKLAVQTLNDLVVRMYEQLKDQPGSLLTRQKIVETALAGLERIVASTHSGPDTDETMIAAYRSLGDVYYLLGREDESRNAYKIALQLLEMQLEDGSLEQAWNMESEIHVRLASLALSLHDFPTARQHLETSLALLDEPDRSRSLVSVLRNKFDVRVALAEMLMLSEDHPGARQQMQALDLIDEVEATEGMLPNDLLTYKCIATGRLANFADAMADTAAAADHFARFHDLANLPVVQADTNPNRFAKLLVARRGWGAHLINTNRRDEAVHELTAIIERFEALTAVDPDNVALKLQFANTWYWLGIAYRAKREFDNADAAFANSIEMLDMMVSDSPAALSVRRFLPYACVFRMELAQRREDFESASQWCSRALDAIDQLDDKGMLFDQILTSARVQLERLLMAYDMLPEALAEFEFIESQPPSMAAILLVLRGQNSASLGDDLDAARCVERLLEIEPDDNLQFAIHMVSAARIMARCVQQLEDTPNGENHLFADQYVAVAVTALRRGAQYSPVVIDDLQLEPDLDPIRQKPEFVQMLLELSQ